MSKLSEWESFTEVVFELGASEAYLEYYKDVKLLHKPKPSESDFRKKAILFSSKRASHEEQHLADHKEKFHEYFELAKGRLERKEPEKGLEMIIQKWHDKLKKEMSK